MTTREPSLSPRPTAASPVPRRVGWAAGLAALVLLSLICSWHAYPPLPATLKLELMFPAGIAGQREPIVCTGMWSEGDLLVLVYLDETTAVLNYDHWGHGGPSSSRIAFRPGVRRTLQIEMPAFTTFRKPPEGAQAPLRLTLDGRVILATDVLYHGRLPKQIYFGENSIGGSAATAFRGKIRREGGHVVRGGPESYFTTLERLRAWLRPNPWQAAVVVVASIGVGWAAGWLAAWRIAHPRPARARVPRTVPGSLGRPFAPHRWFAGAALLCTLGYTWLVTLGTFDFNRAEIFGNFYDYQAASLLQGRLDVPEAAIGPEAFEAKGKLYGYFGPTPALLRLPFVALGLAFGKLSRAFMLLYFVASLLAAYAILREAVKSAFPPAHTGPTEPSPFAAVVLTASVGLGSTIFFLGSRGLIFHEAILAGITFALWSCWCTLRHLRTPARRWWVGGLIIGVLSLHCRPPTGLFALTLLGCVTVILAARERPRRLLRHGAVAALCFAGLLSLNGLAWLKFGTFDPAPLRISRPYAAPGRLAYIDGKSFHLVNLGYNFDAYVLFPNFRVERQFPWVYLGSKAPRRHFPLSKIDLPDHTLAMPFAMPSLFVLATLGSLGAVFALPGTRAALLALWGGVLPMSLALFAAIATAQRYTGDFCPFLICAATFGLTASDCVSGARRALLRACLAALTFAAILTTTALTLHYQGDTLWGVPDETRGNYQRLRQRVDDFFDVEAP